MNDYQKMIHQSRYARWNEKLQRRETWEETVQRYMDFWDKDGYLKPSEKEELRLAILNLEAMPSMRCMMTAGKALERDNVAGFNCSYLPIDNKRSFDELMYILMCGTGVGFSVERQYVNKLPCVAEEFFPTETVLIVRDSKIGWATAFKELVSLLYEGSVPSWDTSKVRPEGSRLKTFGGRASGAKPLEDLFAFTVELFKKAAGRKLSSIECHDLCCKVADIVVVGGVRRSALISLSNLSDDRLRAAKTGQWWETESQRALANNSACYTEKPEFETFLSEWHSLYESKSGERGILSRPAMQKKAAENGRRDPEHEFGTNPCCFTGDMKLLTEDGYKTFKELEGKDVTIVNAFGDVTEGSVWSSGEKPVVEVKFHHKLNKAPIVCTPDHIFMLSDGEECEAKDLKGKRLMPLVEIHTPLMKEEFLAGFMLGDASLNRLASETHKGLEVYFSKKDHDIAEAYGQEVGTWYSEEAAKIAEYFNLPSEKIGNRGLPVDISTVNGLAGLYSANGSVIKGARVSLKSIDKKQIEAVKSVLSVFNIDSYITTNKKKLNNFPNGEYECKESYDLNISKYDSLQTFSKLISFGQQYKREALKELLYSKAPSVSCVKEAGVAEVFDFTEPETHWGVVEGVVVHNSEIILRPNQFCNLSEVVVRADDSLDDLKRKVRLATIFGKLQSTLTNFNYLRKIWQKNTEEEALLGVSLTGIMDHQVLSGLMDSSADKISDQWLEEMKQVAIETDAEYSKRFGVNISAAITCVKPSGTVSQLTDTASGIHPRFSPYYIRTVRADMKDPLAQFLKDSGVPCEPDHINPDSVYVFSFPQKAPEGAICTKEVTAKQQLDLWLKYYEKWCEHKPSITIYYKDSEFLSLGQEVFNNFDKVSGISFLPYSDHSYKQAPYQEISKQEYEEFVKKMPVINWGAFWDYEKEDNTTGTQELACTGGVCEIQKI